MYQITIETHFSSAHRLRNYNGECERLHGHNWKVQIFVASDVLSDLGMVMDFKDIKSNVKPLIGKLDHQYLNDIPPFTEINPTTENISKYLFDEFSKLINTDQIKVTKVEIWESTTSSASYTRSS
jgi:6-pyruvoyltetrahydropterin/6-carboxytetrahydropterin synthase